MLSLFRVENAIFVGKMISFTRLQKFCDKGAKIKPAPGTELKTHTHKNSKITVHFPCILHQCNILRLQE